MREPHLASPPTPRSLPCLGSESCYRRATTPGCITTIQRPHVYSEGVGWCRLGSLSAGWLWPNSELLISRLKVRFLHGSPLGARGPEPLAPFGFSAFRLCTLADFAHRQKPPLVRFRLVAAGQGEMQVVEQKTESFGRQVLRDSIGTGCSSGVPTKSRGVA
jgi:hypothetical protein